MAVTNLAAVFSGVIATQSAPLDTAVPSLDTATTFPNGIRATQVVMEFDLYGSSGTVTATIDLYLWDGNASRWAKCATSISLSSTATASGPASRTVYALDSIVPYSGVLPVVSAISGTGANCSCRIAKNGP